MENENKKVQVLDLEQMEKISGGDGSQDSSKYGNDCPVHYYLCPDCGFLTPDRRKFTNHVRSHG